MSNPTIDLLGIGNALVDVLAQTSEKFVKKQSRKGMTKGSMNLVDDTRAREIYEEMAPAMEMSGGSAANTMAAFASLGGSGAYIGKVAGDQLGEVFRHDMQSLGIRYTTQALIAGPETGRCLVLITPDAQRTMNTYLGASVELKPSDIDHDLVSSARITYLEGYLFDPPMAKEAFRTAAAIAHEAGNRVALTLSDPFCVERHRQDFHDLVTHHVDILFANEDEIKSLYEVTSLEAAASAVEGKCEIAVITRSEEGSIIIAGRERIHVPARKPEHLLDTTGAGDAYAAGFLYGLSKGMALKQCGELGTLCATEIISQIGPRSPEDLSQLLDRLPAQS